MTEELVNTDEVEGTDEEVNPDVEEVNDQTDEESAGDDNAVEGLKQGIQAERQKRQNLESELALLKNQLNQVMYNQQASQPKIKTPFDEFQELGDEEVMMKKDVAKLVSELRKEIGKTTQVSAIESTRQRLSVQDPQYWEKITTYLPKIIEQKPLHKKAIANLPDHEQIAYAYDLVSDYLSTNDTEVNKKKAKKVIDNSKKVKSISSVSSTSAGTSNKYKDMTDADFMKQFRNKASKA